MEYKALKEIAKITMGQSPDSSSYNEDGDGMPFFQGNADFGEIYPNERIWCNDPKKTAEPGDILISVRAPIGALNYAKDRCCIGRGLAAITIDDEAERNYVFHLLKAKNSDLNNQGTGSTFKAIGKAVLEDVQVPQISREEQQKCMDIMDLLESIIRERRAQLSSLDELIKARFVEMFGDPNIEFKSESHKFKEYVFDMTKGPFGSDMKKDLYVPKGEDTYKVYIQINAIQGNQDLGDYYISKEYFDQKISRFEVHPGDYIITCDGTLGKHLKLNENMERGVISPSLLRLTLDESKMTRENFEYMWDMYMLLLMKKEARNACLIHLPSAKVIGEVDVPVAPFELQKNFSAFVEQVDKSKFVSN